MNGEGKKLITATWQRYSELRALDLHQATCTHLMQSIKFQLVSSFKTQLLEVWENEIN